MVYLHLIPIGGLANRLRAYASAAWIAERAGATLVVDWRVNTPSHWDCGAGFAELFATEVNGDVGGIAHLPVYDIPEPPVLSVDAFRPGTEDRVIRLRTQYDLRIPDLLPPDQDAESLMQAQLARLEPVAEISRRVAGLAPLLGNLCVGVHIRTGLDVGFDRHALAVEDFFPILDALAARHPQMIFYVASDSEDAVARLIARFGPRVVTANGAAAPVSRRSIWETAGVQEALVDLLMLSRTWRMLGTYYSSFTDVASLLGSVPLLRLRREEDGSIGAVRPGGAPV